MTDLFRPISVYDGLPAVPVAGLDGYAPGSLAAGTWTSPAGSPSRAGRAGEPLLFDRWQTLASVPLGDAVDPDSLLLGPGLCVVNGRNHRGAWDDRLQPVGTCPRGPGGCFLDVAGGRLLAEDPEGGLSSYTLPDLRRDGAVALAFPQGQVTRELLQGPDALVLISVQESPFAAAPKVVVEAVQIRDYTKKSASGLLRGLEPLAGIVREVDGRARAAAARSGPVLATEEGILWYDWRLGPLHQQPVAGRPLALSVDERRFACLLSSVEGVIRFRVVPPGGPLIADVEIPGGIDTIIGPPVVGAANQCFVVTSEAAIAFSAEGVILWRQSRRAHAPATLTSNGILLLPDGDLLYAVMPDGHRRSIWQPPSAPATAAVLAGDRIYVATADILFVLGPA